ncbi:MAG: hypothetical protein CSA33_08260 [Desulfobulbus propionicus]|nr:MAG: hypothetical protein CSA33_08260 [Desulfobulbus propionicus]
MSHIFLLIEGHLQYLVEREQLAIFGLVYQEGSVPIKVQGWRLGQALANGLQGRCSQELLT